MNTTNQKRCLCLLPLLWLLAGCAGTRMPDQVASDFWSAASKQDEQAARAYVTRASRSLVDFSDGRWNGVAASFGEIRIRGQEAVVVTELQLKAQSRPLQMDTVLEKEDGYWRVDYSDTMATAPVDGLFQGMMEDWKALGEELSGSMKDALSDLERDIPRLQRELEKLGGEVQKNMEDVWQKHVPELQRQFQEFSEALEKALEDARRKHEKPAPEPAPAPPPERQDDSGDYI